ncbi:LarC family nickel insertion protein [Pararhizobium haloflavum]|uniref:LarC family nickel insertion protein n=1 Tax=Pararhizobium haloflavum TaxID=2037914 RepID=UPI000C1895BC|nr:LarC family nickel insertion protein [Pararhizobium haloflavum]
MPAPEDGSPTRIHLDLIGGLAGDMFVAAVCDAFPEKAEKLSALLHELNFPDPVHVSLVTYRDDALVGRRFLVDGTDVAEIRHAHGHEHEHEHGHGHRAYRDICRWLDSSGLADGARVHAHGLFRLLAEAEGAVHGVSPDDVVFHEVGALDSIVDFVAAAFLIDAIEPARWTWSPIPLGAGRVRTAHGVLPVPAPATALLLKGLEVIDDGVSGERVTPTGAAILKYLTRFGGRHSASQAPSMLIATGCGFGTRKLPGLANVTRCLAFAATGHPVIADQIASIQFEIDDQSAEDLAVALDSIRLAPGVLEVFQLPLYGKKGRLATQVQILVEPQAVEAAARLVLDETTTLGLRIAELQRRKLRRRSLVDIDEAVRTKLAWRPGGALSVKAEMDDLAALPGGAEGRLRRRRRAERGALDKAGRNEDE